jgi:hypothetical protein
MSYLKPMHGPMPCGRRIVSNPSTVAGSTIVAPARSRSAIALANTLAISESVVSAGGVVPAAAGPAVLRTYACRSTPIRAPSKPSRWSAAR